MNIIRVLLTGLVIFGSAVFVATDADADTRPAIIFIPGLYGSALRDVVTKKRIFITPDEAMSGKDTLSLYQEELQTPAGPKLEKDGVLEKIVVIPNTYEIDIYGQMLDSLRAIPGHQVIPFDYDWRQDIHVAVADLDRLVANLQAQGVKTIDVVGHSGGALIATYFAAYGTQNPETAVVDWSGAAKIHRLALIGGPFKGSFNIFRDIVRGSTIPMMSHLMPAETISSFPFLYMTLPYVTSHLVGANGQTIPFALDDVSLWKKSGFGLYDRSDLPPSILHNRDQFTTDQIARGRKYFDLMQLKAGAPAPASLKILNVVGLGTATTDTAYSISHSDRTHLIFDTDDLSNEHLTVAPLQVDGDGMVTADSSTAPPLLKPNTRLITSSFQHDKLVEDTNVQAQVAALITAP